MSERTHDTGATPAPSTDELRTQVEETRARLGATAEALAAKTDVTARAKEKAAGLKDRVQDSTPEPVRAKARQATELARRNRAPVLAAGAGAVVVTALAIRGARGTATETAHTAGAAPVPTGAAPRAVLGSGRRPGRRLPVLSHR